MVDSEIYQKVFHLVASLKTNNPFLIARGLDVAVLYELLPKTLRGFVMQPFDNNFIIVINTSINKSEYNIVLAHEIGHIVLGHVPRMGLEADSVYNQESDIETEANLFAEYLLEMKEGTI